RRCVAVRMNYAGERIWANQTELGQSHLDTARPQLFDTVWLGPGLAAQIPTSAHNSHDCAANDRRSPPASAACEFQGATIACPSPYAAIGSNLASQCQRSETLQTNARGLAL